jgi:hypothetical protein
MSHWHPANVFSEWQWFSIYVYGNSIEPNHHEKHKSTMTFTQYLLCAMYCVEYFSSQHQLDSSFTSLCASFVLPTNGLSNPQICT